jgi:hypothetical protein
MPPSVPPGIPPGNPPGTPANSRLGGGTFTLHPSTVKLNFTSTDAPTMPLPLITLAVGALFGNATQKPKKVKAVSGYKRTNGKKVKAYLKKAK